jgi:hypothetical protein
MSTAFANSANHAENYLVEDISVPLFQRYLAKCHRHDMANQPVYLRNIRRETNPPSDNTIILNLDFPSTIRIKDVADRILYADADIVHLRNTSTGTASHLYELLKEDYSHFIHLPYKEKGVFVASKYPLRDAEVTRVDNGNASYRDILRFTIHEDSICSTCAEANDLSIQNINSNDNDKTEIPILLVDLPGTFSVLKPQKNRLSSNQLGEKACHVATEVFEILSIQKREGNDKGGGYGGGRIDVTFGPDGADWSASLFGGYEDENGNYVEAELKRNDDGTTSAGAEAGHDKDK